MKLVVTEKCNIELEYSHLDVFFSFIFTLNSFNILQAVYFILHAAFETEDIFR
jgi:hypothetical protein